MAEPPPANGKQNRRSLGAALEPILMSQLLPHPFEKLIIGDGRSSQVTIDFTGPLSGRNAGWIKIGPGPLSSCPVESMKIGQVPKSCSVWCNLGRGGGAVLPLGGGSSGKM